MKNVPNIVNNLQHTELNQSLVDDILNKDSDDQKLPIVDPKIIPTNSTRPSCSLNKDNIFDSVKIKTEPDTINKVFNQGTYRHEEDSVIVVYSSDEENYINGLELPNNKINQQEQINDYTTSMKHSYPSTSKIENNLNVSEPSIQYQKNEIVSDDNDDDVIYIPPNLNSNNINTFMSSSDSDNDYTSKCPKIIEPFPMKVSRRGQAKLLDDNKYVIKTRAKSEKIMNNKKKADEIIVDQNKQIVQERQLRLKKLIPNTTLLNESLKRNQTSSTNDHFIDKPSTIGNLKTKRRVSRLGKINNDNCMPSTSTSTSHLPVLEVKKKVELNRQKLTSTINNQIEQKSFSNKRNVCSSTTKKKIEPINFAYFDTISKICKWNAVWLYVSFN